jgi:hypothetical protein
MQNEWGIPENVLEDWICDNPEDALGTGMLIIGRQVKLKRGALDILAFSMPDNFSNGYTLIIELKARPIKSADISQVLRYTYHVKELFRTIISEETSLGRRNEKTIEHYLGTTFASDEALKRWGRYSDYHGITDQDEWFFTPVLIGTDISDNEATAAHEAGIAVLLWAFDRKQLTFKIELSDLKWAYSDKPFTCSPCIEKLHHLMTRICKDTSSFNTPKFNFKHIYDN